MRQTITKNIAEEHETFWKKLTQIKNTKTPRNYLNLFPTELQRYLRWCFTWRTNSIAYFCATDQDDTSNVSFVVGKRRVSPKKRLSLPLLELLAAVIATRSTDNTLETHTKSWARSTWSDSSTVIAWFSYENKWPIFVFNRISNIFDTTTSNKWRSMKWETNQADLGRRRLTFTQILESTCLHGTT